MEIIKTFTAIRIGTKKINKNVSIDLDYGNVRGAYYDETNPKEEFGTEQEAIEYAYKEDKYASWLILPKINFKS